MKIEHKVLARNSDIGSSVEVEVAESGIFRAVRRVTGQDRRWGGWASLSECGQVDKRVRREGPGDQAEFYPVLDREGKPDLLVLTGITRYIWSCRGPVRGEKLSLVEGEARDFIAQLEAF